MSHDRFFHELRGIVSSIHLIYRYWSILFFLHEELLWFYLHIYAAKYVYFWILQRRLARHWGAGVIHAGSRLGYLEKNSRIELCMVDKGLGGRQYQKKTLASNPKRDYRIVTVNLLSVCRDNGQFCKSVLKITFFHNLSTIISISVHTYIVIDI
jgi:hypothetical protein